MTRTEIGTLAARSREQLLRRNDIFTDFFQLESPRLAAACHEMSRRFLAGGRLLAFGEGAAATDAQHVSVEFVHPVIVGKRALPALDLGPDFAARMPVLVRPDDMVLGFSFARGDAVAERALRVAEERGALTVALAGDVADYPFALPDQDVFVCQEVFEVLYHMLWESVHVYFEHREQGHDVGASSFLYPFLGSQEQPLERVVDEVQSSMLKKLAEVNRIRAVAADTEVESLVALARAIAERLAQGGKLIAFGNGGSATDANDLVADCVAPPPGITPIPAISLAAEPANLTAIANDIGSEAMFARQLIAHAHTADVAVGISTSGGSANILAALAEARKRGLLTVGIVGYDGGKIVRDHLVDHALVVRSDYIPRIQEVQASLYHVLRGLIETFQGGY
ncbi:MAG: sugar isomerase [Chloroflexi bacterium]|jgi:D-sedoheptulose 7-phosphate isomerase|nr:sugar isomerase [Chloroflexota bacterium]